MVGSLIINFGAIESQPYAWLRQLGGAAAPAG
jgi:hypothetical protein